jgi:hypothetical protein
VNEIQLILRQLRAERERAVAIARACAAAEPHSPAPGRPTLEEFRQASVEYLACVLAWFEERDQRLGERYAQLPSDDPDRRAVERILTGSGGSREALGQLEHGRWQEAARLLAGPWTARREALEERLAANPRVADWRAVGGLTADSILEERRRYARVRPLLPAGAAALPDA